MSSLRLSRRLTTCLTLCVNNKVAVPFISIAHRQHAGLAPNSPNAPRSTPTAYEADKDYWSLKTTIDDIRAKYGLKGGMYIKDANLDQNSDLELEVDLTAVDVKKLARIQDLLQNAARDLENLVQSSLDSKPRKQVWLAEDDDVSGNMAKSIESYQETTVAGSAAVNAYTIDDEEKPAGFQDVYNEPNRV